MSLLDDIRSLLTQGNSDMQPGSTPGTQTDPSGNTYRHFNSPVGPINVAMMGQRQSAPTNIPQDFRHAALGRLLYGQPDETSLNSIPGIVGHGPPPSSGGESAADFNGLAGHGPPRAAEVSVADAHQMYHQSQTTPTPGASPTNFPAPGSDATGQGVVRPSTQGAAGKATSIDSFMNSISSQESLGHGGYAARNPDTGAIGKYQIMPNNWGPWAKAAGLGANAAPTPQNQETVARNQIQALYNKYGNWGDVASVWYSGRPLAQVNTHVAQGKYPSIGSYVESVLGRLHH